MKYINAKDTLPKNLINEIRKYVEGVYIYIPNGESKRREWGSDTNSKSEFRNRNLRIYDAYLSGQSVTDMANKFYLSDKSIRRITLKLRRESEVKKDMINKLLKQWNIQGDIKQLNSNEWSVNDQYMIKEYLDENKLKRSLLILKTLHNEGVPVPEILSLANGADYYKENGKQYLITTLIKGNSNIDIMMCDDQWLFSFGEILGDLHLAFKVCENKVSYWNNNLLEEMNGWVLENLNKHKEDYIDMALVNHAIKNLEVIYDTLPRQLIHRNVFLGNFVFDEAGFLGYLNFDLSQSNIRIFDLCYFLLGILSNGNLNKVDIDKWLNIIKQVIEGYDSKVSLSQNEKEAIPSVMKNIELLFVAYYLGKSDSLMAEEAYKIFTFVRKNETLIHQKLK